ncbi:UNVERIFIED_CONTAM: putative mitochondrial protein, partial [Sesamum radiatum]
MSCVLTISFSLMLDGSNFGFLRPKRGLRQGDPLSPYLFLICVKVFSHLVQQEEARGVLQWLVVSRT